MKKGIQAICILIVFGMLIINISGCTKNGTYQIGEERYVVGVVAKSSSSEYWMSVQSGMETAATQCQMKIIFLSPDSELKEDVQEKIVENLMERNIDALAISPIDSYDIPGYVEKIKKLGIPAVTFDTGFEKQNFPYIGIDNEKVGYELAMVLAEKIGHKGEVGIVAGSLAQKGHKERVDGFQKYMESEKDITVAFIESGYANLKMSEKKVRELLETYPNVEGVFATSGVTALGLSGEMSSKGIEIVTVDEQKDTLDALESGTISALAPQSGYEIGYETIKLLDAMRRDNEECEDKLLDVQVLTKDNVREYRRNHETQKYSK